MRWNILPLMKTVVHDPVMKSSILFISLLSSVLSQLTVEMGLISDETFRQSNVVMRKAVTDANTLSSTFSFGSKDSSQRTCSRNDEMEGQGAYQLCNLYYQSNITVVFGPICYKDLEIAARLTNEWNILQFNFWTDHPSDGNNNNVVQMSSASSINIARNLGAAFNTLTWDKICVFACPLCFEDVNQGKERVNAIIQYLQGLNIHIKRVELLPTDGVNELQTKLNSSRSFSRILLPIMTGGLSIYEPFLRAMSILDMRSLDYIAVVYVNLYSVDGLVLPWTTNSSLKTLYNNVVVIYNDVLNSTTGKDFLSKNGIHSDTTYEAFYYLQLYESVNLYAQLVQAEGQVTNGRELLSKMLGNEYIGPFGSYGFDNDQHRISPFRVVAVHPSRDKPIDILNIKLGQVHCDASKCLGLMASNIKLDANLTLELPLDMPVCGFEGELCEQTSTILVIVGIVVFMLITIVIVFVYRRLRRGNEIREMPWALAMNNIQYIDINRGADTNATSIHSLQLLQEMGGIPGSNGMDGRKDKVVPRYKRVPVPPKTRLATVNNNFGIIYTYKFVEKRTSYNREEIHLFYQLKQIVHDNLNAFIGLSYDTGDFIVAWAMCFKGTLNDVLRNQREESRESNGISLTHNFKGAFVRDILKGLEFLTSSGIGYHGALTPTNCLVDSHWILKLSGFGMPRLLHRWRHRRSIIPYDKTFLIPNSELHYYAPELREQWKEAYLSGKATINPTHEEGRLADIFSFGMLLYEILYEKKFCEIPDDEPINNKIVDEEQEELALVDLPNSLYNIDILNQIPSIIEVPENDEVHADLRSRMINCWSRDPKQRPQLILMRRITDSTLKMVGSLVDQMMRHLEQYSNNLENVVKERTAQMEVEQAKAQELLLELLPRSVAEDLQMGKFVEPKTFKHATILYSDIVGFTSLCSESSPMEVVKLLSGIFQAFDKIISHHNTYKVETIGDAYMVASGVPEPSKNHVKNIASVALMNRNFLENFEIPHRPGQHLHCRWGFNSGPVFAGVVGFNAPRYCIFGTTVVIAAKMESSGVPDKIQMTLKSQQLLTARFPEYKCSSRGSVKLEGIATLLTYWLDGVEELLQSDRSSYKRVIAEDEETRGLSGQSNSIPPDTTNMNPDRPEIPEENE